MFQCDLCCTMLELVFTGAPSFSRFSRQLLLIGFFYKSSIGTCDYWPSAFELIVLSHLTSINWY